MSLLEIKDLDYSYDRGTEVLGRVSFAVEEGVNLGIVGESGSGKTTLLRIILGLLRPDSGSVLVQGEPMQLHDRAAMRSFRRLVQMVFQDPYSSLDPRQRVEKIVSEPLRVLRFPPPHGHAVIDAMEKVGLGSDALGRYPHEFSGGQRQRIAIARAIVARPKVLLADEPVSALDLSTRVRIIDLLRSLSDAVTIVMVSHDLTAIASVCQRTVVLEKGSIVELGETGKVLRRPEQPYTKRLLASVPRLP